MVLKIGSLALEFMKNKVTKETTLGEILKFSGAEKILARYHLPCLSCPFAKFEMENLKIGEICKTYGINIESLLKALNKKVEK